MCMWRPQVRCSITAPQTRVNKTAWQVSAGTFFFLHPNTGIPSTRDIHVGAGDLAQVLILPTPEHLPVPRQLIYMWDFIVLASSHSLECTEQA